tara:strand:- start:4484 stop:4864 length:381 start_codon:yes stop_codon:yes gene_type:complete
MKLSKELLRRIIKEELEAVMNEGDRRFRSKYDINPKDYSAPNLHPSDKREAPDFSTPDMQMKMAIGDILMFDAGLSISQSGVITKEIVKKIQEPEFDLTDYLTSTIGISAAQAPEIAEKIMMEISK